MKNIVDQVIEDAISFKRVLSDNETVKLLAQSNEPIVLWGHGLYAEYIYKILNKGGIRVDAVFSDGVLGNTAFHGIPVSAFEDIQRRYDSFIIVRGNGNLMREAEYKQKKGVTEVYSFFDLMGFGWHLSASVLKEMAPSLDLLYRSLSDEISKKSFFAYLKSRYVGNWIFIQDYYCADMYFPEFIHLSANEVFIDCGAYNGDTFSSFYKRVSTWDKYIAFEPAAEPLQTFKNSISNTVLHGEIQVYDLGLWSRQTKLTFIEENDISRIVEGSGEIPGTEVSVTTIDSTCKGIDVSFIKMDLEGSEMEALRGASEVIHNNKPKLAISLYHKRLHLVEIFEFLKHLNPAYQFYFRIHTKVGSDAVLYAI